MEAVEVRELIKGAGAAQLREVKGKAGTQIRNDRDKLTLEDE